MKNRTVRSPRGNSIGNSLDRRLLRYAAVAGTAMAASQNSLEAGVILRNLNITFASFTTTSLDVNLDGINDFSFNQGSTSDGFLTANRISSLDGLGSANRPAGVGINAGTTFVASRIYINDSVCGGGLLQMFVGLRLHLNDGDHFGYFKTSGNFAQQVSTLVSVAYETQAGVSILTDAQPAATPEPGSLALLALGAAGLAALRRKWAKA